jgi:serine/threonine protein kinase
MVTGTVPFKVTNPVNIVMKHLRELPPAPSKFTTNATPDVERVILQTLEKDPARRFHSAKALSNAFYQACNINAAPQPVPDIPSLTTQQRPTINIVPTPPAPARPIAQTLRSRPKTIWIIGIAILVILLLILLFTSVNSQKGQGTNQSARPAVTTTVSTHQNNKATSPSKLPKTSQGKSKAGK